MTDQMWTESDSELFAELGEVFVPGREEIQQVLIDHLPAARDDAFLAVEIGCGTGWLSEAVLAAFPQARVLALDGSPEMLRRTASGSSRTRTGSRRDHSAWRTLPGSTPSTPRCAGS